MYLSDQELAERFRDKRPGRELVAIENAAMPVTVLNTSILAQKKKLLNLLEEFLLRSIDDGSTDISEISLFLGIEPSLLEPALVSQLAAHNITYDSQRRRVSLTSAGRRTAQDLSSVVPVETEVPISFDRAVWKPMGYKSGNLIRRGEAESRGMVLIPAKHTNTIGIPDVDVRDVQRLIPTDETTNRFQVLEVMWVRRSRNAYLPVKMLVFSDRASAEVDLLIVVDGAESPDHQSELAALGGPKALNLAVVGSSGDGGGAPLAQPASVIPEFPDTANKVSGPTSPIVRQLSVYEHGIELQRALTSAKSRLLIISPWIRRAVVDSQFLADVERRLRGGAQVAIGYGADRDGGASDEDAVASLASLQERYSTSFVFSRLPKTQEKILIYDDVYVTTSFDWLSFRGGLGRIYRMDEGTVVESKAYSDEVHALYLAELMKRTS